MNTKEGIPVSKFPAIANTKAEAWEGAPEQPLGGSAGRRRETWEEKMVRT